MRNCINKKYIHTEKRERGRGLRYNLQLHNVRETKRFLKGMRASWRGRGWPGVPAKGTRGEFCF